MSVHSVQLREVADINPKGPAKGELSDDTLVDFVPMAAVSEEGHMAPDEQRQYSEVAKGYTAFKNRDVLLAKITPCFENNKIALADVETDFAFGSTEFHIIRGHDDELDPRYLSHFLRQDRIRFEGERRMTGSGGQRRVPKIFLEELEIPLPPLEEQRRIAAILDQADALRRLRRRSLDRLKTLGQAIFDEMFFSMGTAGPQVGIEAVAEIQVGNPFKSKLYTENGEGVRLCRGANVLPGEIDWSNTARYPSALISDFSSYSLQEGDVVLAMDRPWISSGFKAAQIRPSDLPSYLVQRVSRFRAKRPEDKAFLYFLIRSQEFQSHCRPTETTVPHISPVEIRAFQFALPAESERAVFQDSLDKIFAAMNLSMAQETRIEALFSSLQHRAFRGEL